MRTDLQVPFDEKHQAQSLGARWDAARKVWFVPDGVDLTPFLHWVPGMPKLSKKIRRELAKPDYYKRWSAR